MRLFSKRHWRNIELPDSIKTRLKIQMGYCLANNFFEQCFLTIQHGGKNFSPNSQLIFTVSRWELWYSIEEEFDLETLELQLSEYGNNNHWYLFDFLELMIIFCKSEKRDEFIWRLRKIFEEEGELFIIHNYLIVPNQNNGLESIMPFIKDRHLKDLIASFYQASKNNPEYSNLAKISANILNNIFSSEWWKDKTKAYSEALCMKLAAKFSPEKSKDLYELINAQVISAKSLNNNIWDVRHTEKHTISIVRESWIYKYITENNMHLIELVISWLPEDYISDGDSEEVKSYLLSTYSINRDTPEIIADPF